MTDVFPTAATLRSRSQYNSTVHGEVTTLETAVLTASNSGLLETTIENSTFTTPGATAQSYWNVWQNNTTDRVLSLNMSTVISHFERLGYSIIRLTNTDTANTFYWKIQW